MKLLNIQQNTPEWDELRRLKLGASDIARLMVGSESEIYNLYEEKIKGKTKFKTYAMQRGHDMEPKARAWLNDNTPYLFAPAVAVHDTLDWLMASFDGLDMPRGVICEIKCPLCVLPDVQDHDSYVSWWWQVQAQLCVSGYSSAILLVYGEERQVVHTIHRDEVSIQELMRKGAEFYQRLINFDPPPQPLPEREDPEIVRVAEEWRLENEKRKEAEEKAEKARERLIELSGGNPYQCLGVKVSKYFRTEYESYKSILKQNGIDLEQYKKGMKESWRVA